MTMRPETRDLLLRRAADVLDDVGRSTRLLEVLAWPRHVEHAFFERDAEVLPAPSYDVDRDEAARRIDALNAFMGELDGDHVLLRWLRSICASFVSANRMLLAMGTRDFYTLSLEIYGGASSTALDGNTSNLDFADHVAARLGHASAVEPEHERLSTDAFVEELQKRLAHLHPSLPVEIIRDADLSAKVVCGATRLRVREGATFDAVEARGLFHHEIETHALTAQNGAAQTALPFLRAGGPRTTRTQEGLAVFAEMHQHALTTSRLRRIVERVRMVGMAEAGASFIDLYRHLLEAGQAPTNAYLDAQRICRGGIVSGGAPFTKDAAYLSGLLDVYNFLRVALRAGAGHIPRTLIAGRIALDDIDALEWLRVQGVLAEPLHVPRWVTREDELIAYFAFTSFLNEVDLGPVEERHRALLDRAAESASAGARRE
jgi:uncharacterized protein (TIGR02421 family)